MSLYDKINHIYFINLEKSTDRKKARCNNDTNQESSIDKKRGITNFSIFLWNLFVCSGNNFYLQIFKPVKKKGGFSLPLPPH
mgnify:CR=1 FL=1